MISFGVFVGSDAAPSNTGFVAVASAGSGTHIVYSADGITWTAATTSITVALWVVGYSTATGRLIAAGDTTNVYYSDDLGDTWTTVTNALPTGSPEWRGSCIWTPYGGGNGRWCLTKQQGADASGNFAYSDDDGATWTQVSVGGINNRGIAYDSAAARLVLWENPNSGDNRGKYSDNGGATWSNGSGGTNGAQGAATCAYSPTLDRFFSYRQRDGFYGGYTTSADGVSWAAWANLGTIGGSASNNRTIWTPSPHSKFITVLDNGNLITSTDGITGTLDTSAIASDKDWMSIAYSESLDRLCVVGEAVTVTDIVATSDDGGDTWTLRNTSQNYTFKCVVAVG